jgi:hypothetical protein
MNILINFTIIIMLVIPLILISVLVKRNTSILKALNIGIACFFLEYYLLLFSIEFFVTYLELGQRFMALPTVIGMHFLWLNMIFIPIWIYSIYRVIKYFIFKRN